ncbi:MAG TPA: MFS transporter [Aggregatilineaceae bacterium]|nr:MFS transporter [Aggregatilineaceae bacterium]
MRKLWRAIGHDTRWVMYSYMLWGVGEGLWMFIQPLYVRSLGATPEETGFTIGMWGLARLLFILPAGYLADRLPARRLLIPGWGLGLIGVVIIALAPDWRWAAPGFFVYGLSSAAIPITNLYLTQSLRHDQTRHPELPLQASLTLLWAAYSAGLVVSPLIGGAIGDAINLRAVFLVSVFWFVLSTLAILQTHPYPATERPPNGHDYRSLLRRPVIVAFGLMTLGFIAVLVGQPLVSQYLEEEHHFSRTALGAFGSVNALGTLVFSLALGRLSAWHGFFVSLLLVMLSFVMMIISGAWLVVIPANFLLGAYYASRPLAVSVISTRVPDHQHGIAYALVDTLAGLATVIGTNTAGLLYGHDPVWPFAAGIIGVIGVVVLGASVKR